MAKLPTKKKEKTPEEQAAELAAMMGDVSPIRLTPSAAQPTLSAPSPQPSTPSEPTKSAASVTPAPSAAHESSATSPLTVNQLPVAEAVIEPAANDRRGEENKNSLLPVAPQPALALLADISPAAEDEADDDALAEQTQQEPIAHPILAAEANYDVKSLFVPTKDKKTVMFRITPAMHQYFQQIGMILGNNTSVPDVVHNILTQWKAQHGAQVQKAMQKQLRQMLKN